MLNNRFGESWNIYIWLRLSNTVARSYKTCAYIQVCILFLCIQVTEQQARSDRADVLFFLSTLHEKHDGKNKKRPSLSESVLSTHSACYWTTITNNNGNLLAPSSSSRLKFNRTSASLVLLSFSQKGHRIPKRPGTRHALLWQHFLRWCIKCVDRVLVSAVQNKMHCQFLTLCV